MEIEQMAGKKILIVGVRDVRKNFIWDVASRLGVQCYVVGTISKETIEHKVTKYICYDFTQHREDELHCDVIAGHVESEIGDVDGCLMLWDDCIPLTALLCSRLGKPGNSYSGARAAKQKDLLFKVLEEAGKIGISVKQYLSRCCKISSLQEVEESSKTVGFPSVMKTNYGGGAFGTKLVSISKESLEHFKYIQSLHAAESDRLYFLSAGFGKDCILMEFLEGSEHCVDLVIFHGELLCAFLTDKGLPVLPDTFHTVMVMPSLLAPEKQGDVIKAAFECCKALGLNHGLFDVDIMLTESGPKMIEINARMGGLCQRDLILHCYCVDLFQLACMLACDVRIQSLADFFPSPHDSTSSPSPSAPGTFPSTAAATRSLSTALFHSNESLTSHTVSQENVENSSLQDPCPRPSCFIVGLAVYAWRHETALKSTATPEILQRLHDERESCCSLDTKPCYENSVTSCPFARWR